MCGGGGSQTVTQKQEIDPVLRAHLYGGTLPEGAMTGIMPVYFQPGGSLADQAAGIRGLYAAERFDRTPVEPRTVADRFDREGGADRFNEDRSPQSQRREQEAAAERSRMSEPGAIEGGYGNVGGGLWKDGGMVETFQEGGTVDASGRFTPLSLAEQVYQLSVGTDLGAMLPEYQVAGRTPLQQQAEQLAAQGIGGFQPYLQTGAEAVGTGITEAQRAIRGAGRAAQRGMSAADMAALQSYLSAARATPFQEEALGAIRQGREMLGGAAAQYDPMAYRAYMDPYTEDVIRQSERDIARMGDIERQRIGAGAVRAGAFGGSRQAIAEAELARNMAEQQARTAAQLRSQGFQTAQQQAQQAFEQQQQRQLATGQSFGQLGTQTGALGTSFGQLGLGAAGQAGQLGISGGQLGVAGAGQQAATAQGIGSLGTQLAGLGGQAQQYGLQDINTLLTVGAQQQGQTQAELDAARMSQFQRVMAPFQQTAFRADVLSGSPTGIVSTFTQPGPSAASQIAGLGLGAYGLSQAFR